jgi:hypothetical protein
MQEAFFRPFTCPGCDDQSWVLVSIKDRVFDAKVEAFASRAEAMSAMGDPLRDSGVCEAFIRPVRCPGPTGELLVWFGDDPLDANVRAFATLAAAYDALASLLEAETNDPDAADDAAKLRQMAREVEAAKSS